VLWRSVVVKTALCVLALASGFSSGPVIIPCLALLVCSAIEIATLLTHTPCHIVSATF